MRQIDKETVKSLQGKAPGASYVDRDELSSLFRNGELFTEIPEEYREILWSRVCDYSTHCLVPSLFTFFEDRKFLENVAYGLRNIVGVESKDSISRRLTDMFTDIGQVHDRCVVQVSDIRFGSTAGNRDARLRLGMQQLWLAAFREYENLPAKLQRKNLLAKARPKVNVGALHGLASVALHLGFESDEIHEILSHSADWVIASEALLAARKPGLFEYDNLDQLATQIAGIFAKARPVVSETRYTQTYTNRSKQPARYGLPDAVDHAHDKVQLFLPNIGSDIDDSRNHVTSLFVRMSVYRAYFGQSTLPPAVSQEILISSVPTQENDGGNHNVSEVESGLAHEIQIMEEQMTLQQLKSDVSIEMEKLKELKQQVSHEEATLARLQRNSRFSKLAFDDIVAENYDEFMANEEEPVQDKDSSYSKSAIDLQEQEITATPMVQGKRGNTYFNFRGLKALDEGLLEKSMHSAKWGNHSPPAFIIFKSVIDSDGNLKESNRVQINADAPSQVKQLAAEYMRQKCSLFDIYGRNLASSSKCFDMIMATEKRIIVVKQASQLGIKVQDTFIEGQRHKRAKLAERSD